MRWFKRLQKRRKLKSSKKLKKALATGVAAIAVTASGNLSKAQASYIPDDHELPVAQDCDIDLIADAEEQAIGYRFCFADQNQNLIPDGVELARHCADVINALVFYDPDNPPTTTYKIPHGMWGGEQCDICGQWINMGGNEIINPQLNLHYPADDDSLNSLFLPDLAVHYMEHGSFSCSGSVHDGRVNLPLLLRVLDVRWPKKPNEHVLPLDYISSLYGPLLSDANDLDADLLTDKEELNVKMNIYNPDQDDNITPDGVQLVKQLADAIEQLPLQENAQPGQTYKVLYLAFGLETCDICGEELNMGFIAIVNPSLELEVDIPIIAQHYAEHGSLSYAGSERAGRVDLPLLLKVLEKPGKCGDLGTRFLPGDFNRDCRVDISDLSELAQQWLENTDPSS